MTENEILAELKRLNCTEISASTMPSNPGLTSFSFKGRQEMYSTTEVLKLLKQIDGSDPSAPDDSVWYMIERGMEMSQQP